MKDSQIIDALINDHHLSNQELASHILYFIDLSDRKIVELRNNAYEKYQEKCDQVYLAKEFINEAFI